MISGAHGVGKTSIMTRLARDVPILGVRYIFANERLVTAFDTTTPSPISDVIRASVMRDERGKKIFCCAGARTRAETFSSARPSLGRSELSGPRSDSRGHPRLGHGSARVAQVS